MNVFNVALITRAFLFISMLNAGTVPDVAACPSGVATVRPSTACPIPKMVSPGFLP